MFHVVQVFCKVLHERNALPAGNASLIRKGIKPAGRVEVIGQIRARAYKLEVIRLGIIWTNFRLVSALRLEGRFAQVS